MWSNVCLLSTQTLTSNVRPTIAYDNQHRPTRGMAWQGMAGRAHITWHIVWAQICFILFWFTNNIKFLYHQHHHPSRQPTPWPRTSHYDSFVCFFSDMAAPSMAHHKRVCHCCTHTHHHPLPTYTTNKSFMTHSCVFSAVAAHTLHKQASTSHLHHQTSHLWLIHVFYLLSPHKHTTNKSLWLVCAFPAINGTTNESLWPARVYSLLSPHTVPHTHHKQVIMTHLCVFCHHHH